MTPRGTAAPSSPRPNQTPAAAPLPRRARRFLGLTLAAGAASLTWALVVAPFTTVTRDALVAAGVLVIVGAWLQVRSFTLGWNGQRLAVHPDEALLLVTFLFAPAPIVVLAGATASLLGQLALRKAIPKLAFNLAAQTTSTALGALTFVVLTRAGWVPLTAALTVPLVVSLTNQLLVAALLVRVSPENAWNARALVASVAMSTATGVVVGVTAFALYLLHPMLVAFVFPLAWLVGRILEAGYRQENEVIARQRFARATQSMLEEPDESAVLQAALEACQTALSPLAVSIEIRDKAATHEMRVGSSEAIQPGRVIECAVNAPGCIEGRIRLVSAHKRRADRESERALLESFASTLALGLANARTLSRLRRSERRLRDAFEATPDPILVTDAQYAVVYANHAALQAVPSEVDLVGTCIRDVFDLPDGEIPSDVEIRFAAGSTRVWEAKVAPLRLEDDADGFVIITRDVTERRRLERETQLQQEALARSERLSSLGTLVAGVAHEVNNPLAYMTAGLDLVMMDVEDIAGELQQSELELEGVDLNETKRRLASILSGAARIGEITKALKVVARTSDAKADVLIDVASLAHELELLVRPLVPPMVALVVETPDAPHVLGSPSDLQRALLNLSKNALEALGQGPGRLVIRVTGADGACVIDVIDDGPGMPPEVRSRAFTPFFTTKHDGTGLGLPTVFSIITAHQGTIALEDGPGRGTRFTITLPCAIEPVPALSNGRGSEKQRGRHDVR